MNYIQLLNRLWLLRASCEISCFQADLYYALMHECNTRRWQNPFQCKNPRLMSATGMSKSALEKSRAAIAGMHLIVYTPGVQNSLAPTYSFLDEEAFLKRHGLNKSAPGYLPDRADKKAGYGAASVNETEIFVSTETSAEADAGPQKNVEGPGRPEPDKEKSCAQKESEDEYHVVPYWRGITSQWFAFNEAQLGIRPSFKGRDPKCLREVMLLLEKQWISAGGVWTHEVAIREFNNFLQAARTDQFLSKKFLLKNLYEQYDAIIAFQKQSIGTGMPASSGFAATQHVSEARSRGAGFTEILGAQRVRN